MSEETVAQRMAASLGVSVESVRAAMESAKEAYAPPEESLCGEEEVVAAGLSEEGPVPPLDQEAIDLGLAEFEKFCRSVGRNRVRAYVDAFGLMGVQLGAWRTAFPAAADRVMVVRGLPPLTQREQLLVRMCADGMAGALRELTEVANRVVERR